MPVLNQTSSGERESGAPAGVASLKRLAAFLDSRFPLPFGLRIGWDGILGLIPGVGDLITNVLAFTILAQAVRLKCPPSVLARMGANLLVENLVDAIPIIGNFFDFFWKANLKNIALLERYQLNPKPETLRSRFLLASVLILILLMTVASIGLAVYLIQLLLSSI